MSKINFLPYRYIKEFYNTERLVLPAVRDMVLNGIFLGGSRSTEQGETMLDTCDYPIFDLWAFIIQQYKYSFFETPRCEILVVPDMMSCLPPLCNVVFPDEYLHYGRDVNLRGVTTRFFEQGYVTMTGADATSLYDEELNKQVASQTAFVAPTSDVEPLIYKIIAAECTPKEVQIDSEGKKVEKKEKSEEGESEDESDEDFYEVYSQIPLPEEFHYGANFRTGAGEYFLSSSESYLREKKESKEEELKAADDREKKKTELENDIKNLEEEIKKKKEKKEDVTQLEKDLEKKKKELEDLKKQGEEKVKEKKEEEKKKEEKKKGEKKEEEKKKEEKKKEETKKGEKKKEEKKKEETKKGEKKKEEEINTEKDVISDELEEQLDLIDEYNNYHKLNVLYKYFLNRLYSEKTENIKLTFTPRLVPGLPVLLLSSTGRHLFGLITSLTHHISADGIAETNITVNYQYNYDDVTKRPIYLYDQKGKESLMENAVWKNFLLLSAYFKDKYIGTKMYNDILCDGIEPIDYNPYAWRHKKDKSILGVEKETDLDIKKINKKEDLPYDFIFLQDDKSISTGEIENITIGYEQGVPNMSKEMVEQKERMVRAVNCIWYGYLSAYNKEMYKARFDIYPLREINRYMADLGAQREKESAASSYNFIHTGNKKEWVKSEVMPEINKRFEKYKKEVAEPLKEKKDRYDKLKKRKKEIEEKNGPYRPYPKEDQEELDRINKEIEDLEKELNQKNVIRDEETHKRTYAMLTRNRDYKKYGISLRTFTTGGPFCLEKRKYFKEVYSNKIKKHHFDTEYRTFPFYRVSGKDKGNDIIKIIMKKGNI